MREELRIENYKRKNMQSEHYKGFDMESQQWLEPWGGGGALQLRLYGGVWPQDRKIDPSAD